MATFISIIASALKYATAFIFGSTGEIIGQKSGHLNMGIPGVMYLGALGGILGERIYISSIPADQALNGFMIIFIPIIFSMLFAALGGLVFSFFTVTLHCNQNVTGLTITTFCVGFSCFFIGTMNTSRMAEAGLMLQSLFKNYKSLGAFGEIFCSQSLFTYLSIIVAIAALIIINRTKVGLNLRACGENAAAADAAGINVNRYRYLSTIIGCAIAGLGGLAYEMDFMKGMFNVADAVDSIGWLALCLVIFSFWNPAIGIGTSFLFGVLSVLPVKLPFMFNGQLFVFKIVPYAITVIILIITSILNKKGGSGPEGLGQSYFREDR